MIKPLTLVALLAVLVLTAASSQDHKEDSTRQETDSMKLGAFSVSLAVKDIEASKVFYGKLGFTHVMGDQTQNWLILRNGDGHTIGLFQGMFKDNIMTFNPGWTSDAKNLKEFTDIRDIQRQLKAAGLELSSEADAETTGPASLTLSDPDGNLILIDQHR